ncbi:transmembrane protease serine 11C-like [Xenopus laevis]|uniref:Peptidase S1 domain-containing protein n=2 Tax=Xenopus laevis TaxID=8355 RepID=A0A974DTS6_XENLA|nr:transmembrane protease serine 11C-like [Xenopus laevis]OCT97345.1 hypothetical protein XELAEV_18009575mg [Xenopus laevis]
MSTASKTSAQNISACGKGGPLALTGKIVGGTNAALGSWPWQAALVSNYLCGASLISNTWLVTAAHCIVKNDPNSYTVRLGTLYWSTTINRLKLQQIIVHEKYSSAATGYDIALLKLVTPVTFTSYIQPVCLPETTSSFPDNSSCYITGWGTLKYGGSVSDILQEAQVEIINTELCSSSLMYGSTIKPSMLCAGYVDGKIDSCQGDSGGPLVSQNSNDSSWYLVGIVSFGDGCAKAYRPGVYARVTYLRDWIKEKTGI